MKARWNSFKKRHWDSRAARERQIIALGALLLAPLFAYFLLWQPAHVAVAKLRISVPALRAQASHLHEQAAEVEMLRHRSRPAVLDANSLKTAVEASAVRHQLREAITTFDAQEPNAVRITFASISFEQWLNWLHDLQQEQHVHAESAGIAALPQAGMVKVNATLTNGGAQ